jgi:hypothetical protein
VAVGQALAGVACYQNAIKAQEQQAKSLELRAAVSLARHWANCGNRHQAHDLLAPIYGWFAQGFDTPDFKESKLLLDSLRQTCPAHLVRGVLTPLKAVDPRDQTSCSG